MKDVIWLYTFVNGVVPIEFIKKVIKEENLKWDLKDVKELLKDRNVVIYKDKYFALDFITEESIERLIQKKENRYTYFDFNTLVDYYNSFWDIAVKISQLLQEPDAFYILALMSMNFSANRKDMDDFLNSLKEKYTLSKNNKNEITKLIEPLKFRDWENCGRLDEDIEKEELLNDMQLNKVPDENTLLDYLECVPQNVYKIISFSIAGKNISKEELKDLIIAKFENEIQNYTISHAEAMIISNNGYFVNPILMDDLLMGFVYVYKDGEYSKCYIPKEILDILDDYLHAHKEELQCVRISPLEEDDQNILIDFYIISNGIMKDQILQKLLKEHNHMDFSIKELDSLVKQCGFSKVEHYYSLFNDVNSIGDITELIKEKDNFSTYKIFHVEDSNFTKLMYNELVNTINNFPFIRSGNIANQIMSICHSIYLTKEFMNLFYAKEHISMKESQKEIIFNIIKKYRDKIPMWKFNGYSIEETQFQNKKVKIGRNDPCPCGSGKKYKNCCGK